MLGKFFLGLEQCLMSPDDERYDTQCHDCPYFNPDITVKECKRALIDDAYKVFNKYIKVVRCKDCKHYHPGFTCDLLQKPIMKSDDYFCADGERKEK